MDLENTGEERDSIQRSMKINNILLGFTVQNSAYQLGDLTEILYEEMLNIYAKVISRLDLWRLDAVFVLAHDGIIHISFSGA